MKTSISRHPSKQHIHDQTKGSGLSKNNKARKERQALKVCGKTDKALTSYFQCDNVRDPKSEAEELKEKLASLDQQILKVKGKLPVREEKLKLMRQRIADSKIKAEKSLVNLLRQQYKEKRSAKRVHNENIGRFTFFQDGQVKFAAGPGYQTIHEEKKRIAGEIEKLRQERRTKEERKDRVDREAVERASFRECILKQNLEQLQVKAVQFNKQRDIQKLKMKLAFKQSRCYFAKLDWPVVNKRYQVLELIGTGGFGQVYKVIDLETLQYLALKLSIPNQQDDQTQQLNFAKHMLREQEIHKKLHHKNIARLFETIQLQGRNNAVVVSILELCEGPDLHQYIKQHKCIEEKQARFIIKQVLSALNYMNLLSHKVIHYDLKPQNILMNAGNIKVIDFGLCKVMEPNQEEIELTSVGTGTAWYLPPETFDTISGDNDHGEASGRLKTVSSSSDVWALGVIFYELLYGMKPFCNSMSQTEIWQTGAMKGITQPQFPTNKKVSKEAKNFIRDCLKPNPEDRLQVKKAVNHQYFTNCHF